MLDFSADDSIMVNNRDYNNAFLNACQAADWNNHDNKRLFTIMNTYGLHRIALMNYDNVKYNALAHEKNLHAYKNDRMKVCPLFTKQSAFEEGKKKKNPDDTHIPLQCHQYLTTSFVTVLYELHLY